MATKQIIDFPESLTFDEDSYFPLQDSGVTRKISGENLIQTVSDAVLVDATTSVKGVVQLTDSVSSTSTTTAATPNSVKTVNDGLAARVPTSRTINAGDGITGGGSLTGDVTLTLGTPSTLGVSSTNSVTSGSHTHAVNFPVTSVAGKTGNVTLVDAWRTSNGGDWDNSDLKYFTFKTNTPQVITKQEWEEAKMNIDFGGFTKDMLVPGLHVVECENGDKFLVLQDDLAISYNKGNISWMPLDTLIDSLDRWCIVKVYETKTENGNSYRYGDDNYLTLVWERNPVNKELQELEEQYKILGEKISNLKGKQ